MPAPRGGLSSSRVLPAADKDATMYCCPSTGPSPGKGRAEPASRSETKPTSNEGRNIYVSNLPTSVSCVPRRLLLRRRLQGSRISAGRGEDLSGCVIVADV